VILKKKTTQERLITQQKKSSFHLSGVFLVKQILIDTDLLLHGLRILPKK
jgi:hypothetical protein